MKNVLVNGYFGVNFGDDLFFKILFDRYPNVKFSFYNNFYLKKYYETYKEIFKDYNNVKVNKYNKVRKYLDKINALPMANNIEFSKYDASIFIGGSIFMEENNLGRNAREKKSIYNYFFENKKPTYILGSNFGPYTTEIFKSEYKQIFSKCDDVCFRDEYSYDLFKELKSVRKAPDIVFSLKYNNVSKKKDSVGISLINLEGRDELTTLSNEFYNKIKELTESFIRSNKVVTFFSFSEEQGDLKAINKVIEMISKENVNKIKICNYSGNIDGFLDEFASQENIVGCRFHSVILSQVFNQGIYPLIYSNKTYNVLKDIGLDEKYTFIKDIKNLDLNEVINHIDKNKINYKSIFIEVERQFEKLDRYLKD